MILIDSSVWIDYFNGGVKSKNLSKLIEQDLILINEIIRAELYPILMHQKHFEVIEALNALPSKSLEIFWEGIRSLQILNLKKGINKVGIPDLIIVQHCLEYNIELMSFDNHFKLMSKVVNLRLYSGF